MTVSGRTQPGFTIVELLVVIVVIAILAAITVVSFNGIQDRANQTAVKSDLSSIKKNLEIYKTLEGTYPHSPTGVNSEVHTKLESIDMKLSTSAGSYDNNVGNLLYSSSNDGQNFFLIAAPKNSSAYYISSIHGGIRDYAEDYPVCAADNDTRFPRGSGTRITVDCIGPTIGGFIENYPDRTFVNVYIFTNDGFYRFWG